MKSPKAGAVANNTNGKGDKQAKGNLSKPKINNDLKVTAQKNPSTAAGNKRKTKK